ncbi:MAG: hypothetical protein JNJ65_02235 [Cyclobacteriaceae bacterium]|nr:hypothetical protein [Cyclobacteriaceae bacterium]
MKSGLPFLLSIFSLTLYAQEWYKMPTDRETRWASFENPSAAKGKGKPAALRSQDLSEKY